jgi:hypothetical protein
VLNSFTEPLLFPGTTPIRIESGLG